MWCLFENTDGSDENTMVIMNTHDSATTYMIVVDISDDNMEMHFRNEKRLFKIEERVIKYQAE
jgi:predicted nuclease with TOPRIM domain